MRFCNNVPVRVAGVDLIIYLLMKKCLSIIADMTYGSEIIVICCYGTWEILTVSSSTPKLVWACIRHA